MPSGHSKKARRQRQASRKKRGVISGMRTGFKNAADSVTGSKPKKKTNPIISTLVTLILLAAVIALAAQGRC